MRGTAVVESCFFFFKQKTAYEMRISDWSSDVCSSDLLLEVIIDPVALESYNLDATDIVEMVTKSNLVVAAGALDTGQGRFAVKVPGLFETMEDIVNIPIKVSGDAVVHFRDVAKIGRGSGRERECQYVSISGGVVCLKKKKHNQ